MLSASRSLRTPKSHHWSTALDMKWYFARQVCCIVGMSYFPSLRIGCWSATCSYGEVRNNVKKCTDLPWIPLAKRHDTGKG
ncbi:hypothetical protein PISMIDRAFT_410622 [Pisolithus microcarpus 441]|uniref:Uncharacterized protein n=1 Tax=Pisolithus microcarpus 441 TaxID=765257 RepID=A0A0C9YZK5_9AGAM|nr:hypothetical protein PISMIDRAFT_410622 [Pisolithus microcarpus 441]